MGTETDHLPVLKDNDLIGVGNCRDTLCNDHDSGFGRDRFQGSPEPGVRCQVKRRERVVEDVDLGFADQRPGKRALRRSAFTFGNSIKEDGDGLIET